MGFIILLIRVITHADFQVISPGAGKSMASQIAANGTSQTPVGHSLVAQRAISGSSSSGGAHHTRSCSTSDISDGSDSPKRYYRKRMFSTGNTGTLARSNNNLLPTTTTNSSTSSTKPIVINNYHHLHLHCHRSSSSNSGHVSGGGGGCGHHNENSLTDTPSGTEGMSPVSEITLVNEVQPLLSPPSSTVGPGPRNQRLGPT